MILFRGDPARADDCIERDLPRAMEQAATRLESHVAERESTP
jgi:ribonuclease P protein component